MKVDEHTTMLGPVLEGPQAPAIAVCHRADASGPAPSSVALVAAPAEQPVAPSAERNPESRLRAWWESRVGYRLFLEIGLMYGVYFIYKMVRYQARGNVSDAIANGKQVVHFEQAIGIFNEVDIQHWALKSTDLVRWLNRYYLAAHFTASMLCFIWLYVRRPAGYAKCRRILIVLTLAALVIHVTYPLAPPRMFTELGFVDTAKELGPDTYGENSKFKALANQFAAMPSLHFGWAVLVAYAAVRFSRSRLRFGVIAHPVLTLAAIVLTANHYWLDAIVAVMLLGLIFVADPWLSRLKVRLPATNRRNVITG